MAAIGLTGCGPSYSPVRGTVRLHDGSPLPKGLIVFIGTVDGKSVSARGEIQPDGSYQLGTETPGGGVPPGRYKVLINPLDLADIPESIIDLKKPLPFDAKYLSAEKSGLEFEVQPGPNDFPIKLDARPPNQRNPLDPNTPTKK